MLNLYDFVTEQGRNDIAEWIASLQKHDRARLEQKLTRLTQISFELAKDTHLLAGPVYESIWKVRVNASVMLRPHLCKGPISNDKEYTLLVGAIEKGDRVPDSVKHTAVRRRDAVFEKPLVRRIPHGQPMGLDHSYGRAD